MIWWRLECLQTSTETLRQPIRYTVAAVVAANLTKALALVRKIKSHESQGRGPPLTCQAKTLHVMNMLSRISRWGRRALETAYSSILHQETSHPYTQKDSPVQQARMLLWRRHLFSRLLQMILERKAIKEKAQNLPTGRFLGPRVGERWYEKCRLMVSWLTKDS